MVNGSTDRSQCIGTNVDDNNVADEEDTAVKRSSAAN